MDVNSGHAAKLARLRLERDGTQVAMKKTWRDRSDLPSRTARAGHLVREAAVERDAVRVRDRKQAQWMLDDHQTCHRRRTRRSVRSAPAPSVPGRHASANASPFLGVSPFSAMASRRCFRA